MNTTGLPALWHSVLAILSHQEPFVAILLVTFAALFVVMAIEGFRTSLRAIRHAHRAAAPGAPAPEEEAPQALASPAMFSLRTRSFAAKPRFARPKVLERLPRQFRNPRPVIRRQAPTI
jgi:hypothetical protein